jgi:hypothetical protein
MYFRVGPAASTLGYLRRALNRGAQRAIANNVILRNEANKSFVINGTILPVASIASASGGGWNDHAVGPGLVPRVWAAASQ